MRALTPTKFRIVNNDSVLFQAKHVHFDCFLISAPRSVLVSDITAFPLPSFPSSVNDQQVGIIVLQHRSQSFVVSNPQKYLYSS